MALPIITFIAPDDASTTYDTTPALTAQYDDTDLADCSIFLIEVDIAATFDSPRYQYQNFGTVATGTQKTFTPTALTKGIYYWRVSITNPTGQTVSSVRSLIVEAPIKRTLYQYENVAKLDVWTKKRVLYQYENVAKYGPDWTKTRALYQYENITDDPPFPWIENLSVYRVGRGGSITITGNGFGYGVADDTENADRSLRQYAGEVYIGTKKCGITAWAWQSITIAVPSDAVSGALKVVLNKPDTSGIRTSNLVGVDVSSVLEETETGVELFICEKATPNIIKAQLYAAKDKSFQEVLNAPGAGQFTINKTVQNSAYLTNGNYVLCRINGIDYFKWIIENIKPSQVDSGERGAEKLDVSGRGVLALLKQAIVYPEGIPWPDTLERAFLATPAGSVLITFLEEAQARGALPGVTWDFSETADSFGVPWTDAYDLSFHAGNDLLAVADKIANGLGVLDLYMDSNLKLSAYIKDPTSFGKGADMSDEIIFRPGQALTRLSSFYNSPDLVNVILFEASNGTIMEAIDSASVTIYGRRELYIQEYDIYGPALAAYGNEMAKTKGQLNWGHEVDVSWQYYKIGIDYFLGDYIKIYVPAYDNNAEVNNSVRVKGYTISSDNDTNSISVSLNLNNMLLEKIIELDQGQQRLKLK